MKAFHYNAKMRETRQLACRARGVGLEPALPSLPRAGGQPRLASLARGASGWRACPARELARGACRPSPRGVSPARELAQGLPRARAPKPQGPRALRPQRPSAPRPCARRPGRGRGARACFLFGAPSGQRPGAERAVPGRRAAAPGRREAGEESAPLESKKCYLSSCRGRRSHVPAGPPPLKPSKKIIWS